MVRCIHPGILMFDFDEEDEKQRYAGLRYYRRRKAFMTDGRPLGKARHHALWLLHNVVAHPLLGIAPNEATVALHQITSAWLNKEPYVPRDVPEIPDLFAWRIHNIVAHVLIGVSPTIRAFNYHDLSAEDMGVKHWV